jgi:hypothetical protein
MSLDEKLKQHIDNINNWIGHIILMNECKKSNGEIHILA